MLQEAINAAKSKVDQVLASYKNKFPASSTLSNVYPLNKHGDSRDANPDKLEGINIGWTTGFWTGIVALMYEHTQDSKYLEVVEKACG